MNDMSSLGLYAIVGGVVTHFTDTLAWAAVFEDNWRSGERHIANDIIGDDIRVSSVFLGVDCDYSRLHTKPSKDYKPTLWETMVFYGDGRESDQYRYKSRRECLKWHKALVAMLKEKHDVGSDEAKEHVHELMTRLKAKA